MTNLRFLPILLYAVLAAGLGLFFELRPSPSFPLLDDNVIEWDAWEFAQKGETYWQERTRGGWIPHLRFSWVLSRIYLVVGRAPLALRLFSMGIGVMVLYFTWHLGAALFGVAVARRALWILAFWPSLLYRGATVSRDLWITLWMVICLWRILKVAQEPSWKNFLWVLPPSWILGYYRPQTLELFWFAAALWFLLWLGFQGLKRFPEKRAVLILAAIFLLLPFFVRLPGLPTVTLPSPQELAQWHNTYTEGSKGGTTLFPNVSWQRWGDVLVHLPRALIHALFMPFPGIYPIEGKPSRALASIENLLFFGLCLFALKGIRHSPKTWTHGFLAFFLLLLICLSAILEPDLGSAMRHKMHFLPCLVLLACHGWVGKRREG